MKKVTQLTATFSIALGALTDPLSDQMTRLKEIDINVPPKEIERLETIANNITDLYVQGIISSKSAQEASMNLFKQIEKAIGITQKKKRKKATS
mgnify:CR=1 FL=1